MNLCILLTAANADDLKAFCAATAEKQTNLVNGGLVVVHDEALSTEFVKGIVGPILPIFKAKTLIVGHVNHTAPTDGKIASLLSTFLLAGYSSHPGAWLIVDGPEKPTTTDFLTKLDAQHRAFGGRITGRGKRNPGSVAPKGPITLELSQKEMKLMRFTTNESWRTRGQFLFGRADFGFIPTSEWMFEGADEAEDELPAKMAVVEAKVEIKRGDISSIPKPVLPSTEVDLLGETPSKLTPFNQGILDEIPEFHRQIQEAISDHPELPLTKGQLLDAVESKTGKRPHHFTGEAKLQELLK